jgi:hypothetical protein
MEDNTENQEECPSSRASFNSLHYGEGDIFMPEMLRSPSSSYDLPIPMARQQPEQMLAKEME